MDTPEPRLDQSSTYKAIQELQMFMEYFPTSSRRQDAQQMIFDLQDKLVMKDYLAAKLYYDLALIQETVLIALPVTTICLASLPPRML